jgi:hypothetical protein
VLPDEIGILKPDVVVFFVGPDYLQRLRETFPRFKERPVVGSQVLWRCEHHRLPWHSYFTYHPNYLQLERLRDDVIAKIAQSVSTHNAGDSNEK